MIAIIPAKKKSKRLPNKNIKILDRKPLIAHTIQIAIESEKISRVIVSTDSPKIAKISRKYGAETPFLRSKKTTKDKATLFDVSREAINYLAKVENTKVKSFIYLQPTSPLRSASDIDNAIKIFEKKKADAVISFCRAKPFEWHRYIKKNGNFYNILKKNKSKTKKHQNYLINGSIYIFKTDFLKKNISYNKKCFSYIMPLNRSVDIDDSNDFKFAKYLISRKKTK